MHFLRIVGIAIGLALLQFGIVFLSRDLSGSAGIIIFAFFCLNALGAYFIFDRLQSKRVITYTIEGGEEHIDSTLKIANETLPYMRQGLNEETAQKAAEIILKISDVAAVAITDREKVLAYVGAGCERHQPGRLILTQATKQVIATGGLKIVDNKEKLNCPVKDCDCPLEAAVIAPLKCRGQVAGCLKLYQTKEGQMPAHVVKLAVGIAQLLGVQMELAELDRQAQLVTRAELQALHAQINPHFLFNTLNTIIMFSRTNPETARRLLIRLANFFRQTLKKHGHFNTLREELEYINTYLVLEKARFREKLRIIRDIDPDLMDYQVPVLTLQPLVENAVKHGITPKVGPGAVNISVKKAGEELRITIKDDGVGIPEDKLDKVLIPGYGKGNGVGLSNVNERLKSLFGEEYMLTITSKENVGTTISLRVPLIKDSESTERGEEASEA
ncbi:signal transduction histidine kinase LytS [Thermincola ferriacetica]|uniref:histidine kinase n=1 Tax=Thermincola ferriacetica TaxID=281456 RepID=A0A0L6W2L0_9FIRM|nr:histidine kinase [Thermincola ferriacetica]KNZ69812.1 signal transduction histidine kinase LytS [Thermincola ferriacetica]